MKIIIEIDGELSNSRKSTGDFDEVRGYSQYAKFFDESCPNWVKDSGYNLAFLRLSQVEANDRLKRQGYLFLNDVYTMLGLPVTKAGQLVGWIYDPENDVGDNYVDFGLYDVKSNQFINEYANIILLDFNVDGMIIDKI